MLARYCARCGKPTSTVHDGGHERARCTACGWTDWGNPKAAVGALLVREGRVLLSKRARPPHQGSWDLPGGFLEAGETPEEGIRRELAEETGLDARVLRLVATGVGRYDSYATVNLVFLCEAEGEPRAMDDSLELAWFEPARLPPMAFPHEAAAVRTWASGPC